MAYGTKTLVFPHLLEQSGTILDTQNTFDTQIFVTYTADQAGVSACAEGTPLHPENGSGTSSDSSPKASYTLYGDNLSLGLAGSGNPAFSYSYVYAIDGTDRGGFDPSNPTTFVDEDLSSPMTNELVVGTSYQVGRDFAISGSCSFPMGDDGLGNSFDGSDNDTSISPRKRKINVEQMIRDGNGGNLFNSGIVRVGHPIVVVNGAPDVVSFTSVVVNSRAGPADLSVFVFGAQPIAASA